MSTLFALNYPELKALKPCEDEFASVTAILGDAALWDGRRVTATDARAAGVSMEQVLWVASALALSNREIRRRLQQWNCDCAMRVLGIFETRFPGDGRPRGAIQAGRRYADGLIGAAEWAAARIAAKDATKDAAGTAARSAARAAASDAGDAGWSASWSAGDAAYQSVTDATDAAWGVAWDAERYWQFGRLCEWLSDTPPEAEPGL